LHSNPQIIKKKHLSYNPILKGNSGPKLKAEISFISEYQMQAPLEFYFSFNLKFTNITTGYFFFFFKPV
jgi:hypothetical protein